ncbi:RnfH family protein [Pararobbsia silviterrae]|uniref:UPF0125 protein D7S86_13555 n=1 Tax=Pararobbsia silviterrae TaxID=1792498 RepID=A0A494XVN0_9BURK|nr:RnfH family protein [Pararobbsia silviterrae]RKP54673.1 RnfH family protein [Pararobbsia silviterrae]
MASREPLGATPPGTVPIEICYALPDAQTLLAIEVEAGSTVRQAIERSGIIARHPEIDLSTLAVGVFGKIVALDAVVSAGDRVEIYRPLKADPKMARQRRVEKTRATSVEGRRWVAKERRR